MQITPVGVATLTPLELEAINKLENKPFFSETLKWLGAVPLNGSLFREPSVFLWGRLVIKQNKPHLIKREVDNLIRLSTSFPIFLPVFASSKHFFVAPFVFGKTLKEVRSQVSTAEIKNMASIIGDALSCVNTIPADLHWENVILTSSGFYVIDLEHYLYKPKGTDYDLCDMIDTVLDCLMENN
jgi:hypothetical protein